MASNNAEAQTAIEIEMAKQHLDEELSSSEGTPPTSYESPASTPPVVGASDDFAFAFDIDGVLVKGGQPIPEAVQALKYINGENPYGVKM